MKKAIFLFTISLLISSVFSSVAYAGGLNSPENLHLDHVECGTYPKSYAYFNWNPVVGTANGSLPTGYPADSYRFYFRLPNDQFNFYDETKNTSYKLGFNPTLSYYITVASTHTFSDGQVTESRSPEIYFETSLCQPNTNIPQQSAQPVVVAINPIKAETQPLQVAPINPVVPHLTVQSKIAIPANTTNSQPIQKIQAVTPSDKNAEELNNKVNKLQQQLEQSQKKQTALENTLNNLLNWFHSHVPFFK